MNNQFSISSIKNLFVRIYRFIITRFPIRNYQSLLMFVFFVTLSTVLWLLKVLNKENHTTVINYPVTYVNFPSNKVLVNELPQTLSIEVSGKGFTLLKYMLRPRLKSIRFDVNSFSLNELPGKADAFFTLTRYANQKLAGHFNNELDIQNIKPDTLKFQFSERAFKKVPVILDSDIRTAQLFMINGPVQVTPDSVTISGPALLIDTVMHISTEPLVLKEVSDSVTHQVPLKIHNKFRADEQAVTVKVPVDKYTTKNVSVPVDVQNVPDTISLKIFPASVTVNFRVAVSQYDQVTSGDFLVTADYLDIQESISSQLRLHLTEYPNFIQRPALQKRTVEYLIEK